MEEVLTPEFRATLRQRGDQRFSPEFSRKLSEKGWIGLNWPVEWGGKDRTAVERFILIEELARHDAPLHYHGAAERQVGPSLIRHGTSEQKQEFLPKIVRSELSFCLGLSEPGAGSDLANVATKAVADGDDYVVNGQKIWTSFAHRSDMCWLVVRTSDTAEKHRGISMLLVDMKSPGITVRPLINMSAEHGFNQVFFKDVRVPRSNLVGDENSGWYILAEHLDFERAGIDRIAYSQGLFEDCLKIMRGRCTDGQRGGVVRQRLAELSIELAVGRLLAYRVACLFDSGVVPNVEVSMAKAFGSEWTQRMANAVYDIAMTHGDTFSREFQERAARAYLTSVADTVRAGTSEIQRNIIAQRGLRLPRS